MIEKPRQNVLGIKLPAERWYTPMDIARLGLITTRNGDEGTISGRYNLVLELIKSGQLKAKNYSKGKERKNWLVSEKSIAEYHALFSRSGRLA